MVEKWQQIQGQMEMVKKQLGQLHATAESGAGLVKVTVNGHKHILDISIDPSLLQPSDRIMLQDLVVAAVNAALKSADDQANELLQSKAMGILGQLPIKGL